ncbi:hypothetical protein ALC53_05953 [Atta colombica]|uniref:Uncharacterized protein n=1 Tax=Atta colombica TaxID=520822 RepID=A0A195BH48_9HYME|nr:hypothetical protein ALC53_05953 [Atta colombica]
MVAGKGIGKPRGRSVSLTTYNGTDTSLSARHSCALCCFATSWSQKADQGVENEGDDVGFANLAVDLEIDTGITRINAPRADGEHRSAPIGN